MRVEEPPVSISGAANGAEEARGMKRKAKGDGCGAEGIHKSQL